MEQHEFSTLNDAEKGSGITALIDARSLSRFQPGQSLTALGGL